MKAPVDFTRGRVKEDRMMLPSLQAFALPFPDISPEIFSISLGGFEFALRWYAMAYLVGILLGWALLRDAIAQQRLEVEEMTQQALEAETNAEQQAALSKARAALSEVYAALSAGAPYAEQVNTIEANGVSVPSELSGPAGDGVPTLAALTEDYPPAAREALSEARRLESDAETGTQRFATFLADQIGARSVTPRAGDAPDAILSRAEAALRDGDLQQALTELEALPDEAKAPLSDWMARAQTRVAAVSAADGLAQELNKE